MVKTSKKVAAAGETSAADLSFQGTETRETPVETRSFSIVIGAFPGSEERMSALWAKSLMHSDFKVRTVNPDQGLMSQLTDCLADPDVAEDFVYVPANCFAAKTLNAGELGVPYVYVDKNGRRSFDHRLPVQVSKSVLMDIVTAEDSDKTGDEENLEQLYTSSRSVPVEASFNFGNIVTPVLRGNPCENLVIEAFLRKKYVCTNETGWNAIVKLVDGLLGA